MLDFISKYKIKSQIFIVKNKRRDILLKQRPREKHSIITNTGTNNFALYKIQASVVHCV